MHTHQECGQQTTTTNASGDTVVNANCHHVPDCSNIWTNYQNWRKKMTDDWNKRIEDHRPPQGPSNDLKPIQDIIDIMMVGPTLSYGRFGWRNGAKWRQAVKELMRPGTAESIAGEVQIRVQAISMIEENGGTIRRGAAGEPMDPGEKFGHDPGGVSEHTYPHINSTTASGMKATVKVAP